MDDVYWYISKPKIAMLSKGGAGGGLKHVRIKLKALWLETEATVREPSLIKAAQRVETAALSQWGVVGYDDLSSHAGPVFSFGGEAGRVIDGGMLWIALHRRTTALVLVGSSDHVLGAKADSDEEPGAGKRGTNGVSLRHICGSGDPVGAVRRVFHGDTSASVSVSISRAWRAIAHLSGLFDGICPKVFGLAILGGIFPAYKEHLAWTSLDRCGPIERVVIGSPIFVRQTA